jgi:hypothetical protein
MDVFTEDIVATGGAGFVVLLELLTALNRSGQLSDEALLDIWDRALAAMEDVDAQWKHKITRLAREQLELQLNNCRKAEG